MTTKIPKSIKEAVNDLIVFLECDVWHCIKSEWKCEKDMIKYLREHFEVLEEEIIYLIGKNEYEKDYLKDNKNKQGEKE